MYPLLRLDAERSAWIDRVSADIATLAADSRSELDAANRANRFPRDVFRELGRRGYCGPMVPTEWGGLGGGVDLIIFGALIIIIVVKQPAGITGIVRDIARRFGRKPAAEKGGASLGAA